jgi:hypothetical protein
MFLFLLESFLQEFDGELYFFNFTIGISSSKELGDKKICPFTTDSV